MMRSMFAGVSGLRNHQIRLDVIGNNIANVNTVAYKMGRVNFQDIFSQTIRGASSPGDLVGGTNPQQVGLGMTVASIDILHMQGNLQLTGKMTDLGIQGNGFFVVSGSGGNYYTRAGNFEQDASGYLVNPQGLRLQGWAATAGVFPNRDEANLTDIRIPVGQSIPARASTEVQYAHNLDSDSAVGTTREAPVAVYDSQGSTHDVSITFTKTAVNTWTWEAIAGGAAVGNGTLTFGADGLLSAGGTGAIAFAPPGVAPIAVAVDFTRVTQFAADSSVSAISRDGYPMGTLEGFTIDSNGVVTGVYSNGLSQSLAQVALSVFANPGGMMKMGDNLYEESNNSGIRQIGTAKTGGRGTVAPGNLEMSNVDLAREFTDMITTQRGFQANSRIITTSDEMLQELVNLKR